MSLQELSRALYLERRVLEPAIDSFENAGMLTRKEDSDIVTYAPESDSLAEAIEETADTYRERRSSLINVIYAPPLQHFADAFKFKSDQEEKQ